MNADGPSFPTSGSKPEVVTFFPAEYASAGARWMHRVTMDLAMAQYPFLASIPRETVGDLPDTPPAGASDAGPELFRPLEASHEWTVDMQSVIDGDRGRFLADLFGLAEAFGAQMEREMLRFIADTAESTGQVVDGTGRDLFEVIIEAMESVEFSFDEEGNHNMAIVMNPTLAEKIRHRQPTESQELRMQQLVERKKREWDAARSRRDIS